MTGFRLERYFGVVLAVLCLLAHSLLVPRLYSAARAEASTEMEVVLPRFVQVLMAAGDRFLAADLASFRALVVSTEQMTPEKYKILGKVQSDVAWLNPAHEDNYYVAAAILPWSGEVEAAQFILKAATEARPFDWAPPFYYGFNALRFQGNAVEGGKYMLIAADHASDEMEQLMLQQFAANWVGKGGDLEQTITFHRLMLKGVRYKSFALFIEKRIVRLENLLAINQAADRYAQQYGRHPANIGDLVQPSLMRELPADPFGMVYALDINGRAQAVVPQSAGQLRK